MRRAPATDAAAALATPSPQTTRHVLVIVESSAAYGRACAQGIARYARNHGRWLIRHMPHDQMPVLDPNIPWKWDWDGVIARISDQRLINLVERLKLPAVDLMGAVRMEGVALIDTDHRRLVEMAVEHLLSIGLTRLGFCGIAGLPFSDRRQRCFEDHVLPAGVTRTVYEGPLRPKSPLETKDQRWLKDLRSLRRWVEQADKPIGVVACNDTRARHVIEVCMAAGLRVPRDVCVVGIDNDDVICELCTPTLTSVEPNAEAIGYRAAQVLDGLMRGRRPPKRRVFVPPLGVEQRESTNIETFSDPTMNEAIRFIREHADEGINVAEVAARVGVSRSTLERRFRGHLGCTLHDYIHRLRMERVQRLLLETTYPIAHIAELTGFGTSSYFGAAFRKHAGVTPGQFRRQHTGG